MSKHTTNNQASDGSGVFEPLNDSGFAMPRPFDGSLDPRHLDPRLGKESAGEAELRRLMLAKLNTYFDAEGGRDRVAARQSLHDVTRMPGGSEELAAMRRVLSGFDVRPQSPDLTRVVLAKVGKRGTFLSRPARRRISAARVLIAASLLVVVGTFVYIDRSSQAPVQGPAGAISAVVEAQRSDAAASVRNFAQAVDTLRSDLIDPVGELVAPDNAQRLAARGPRASLAMGDTSGYEESVTGTGSGQGIPLTRLIPAMHSDLGNSTGGLAGTKEPAVARALASAQDAWTVGASPNVLLDNLPKLHGGADATMSRVASIPPLRLDLSGFLLDPASIDDTLARGGLLTNMSSATGSEPEVRLRPDGTRTVLWWIFPNAAAQPRR